jgi:hypothetical protein
MFARLRDFFRQWHIRTVYVKLEGGEKCMGSRLANGETRYWRDFLSCNLMDVLFCQCSRWSEC